MPTPGYVFRDGGTTPEEEKPEEKSMSQSSTTTPSKQPPPPATVHPAVKNDAPLSKNSSQSHALAVSQHEVTGAAQAAGHTEEVTDLGWRDKDHRPIDNLVGGLPNEELWTLVRRFNKQMYHVKVLQEPPPGDLDLNVAEDEEFSPDKLRSNIERLYMTIGIGFMGAGKHIARLRSWREPRRTAAFAIVYFLALIFNFLLPALAITIMVLILVPKSRHIMFPPVPLALVSGKTGGVQKPSAGVLGSTDSATGAPEKHKGEAVEQEASNFVTGIAHVAISSAAGVHAPADPEPEDGSIDSDIPDPTKLAIAAADSKDSATGGTPAHHDKTKQPMEDAVWKQMRPIMRILNNVVDTWERFGNALSPTPPFPHAPRYRIAALVLPLLLVSVITKPYIFLKVNELIVGLTFFTDPLMQRGIKLLNEKVPDWPKYLEVRNTILKGVPTNAQLTITLLRIGEANRAPLPPPPTSDAPPPEKAVDIDKQAITDAGLDASHSDIDEAVKVEAPSNGEEEPAKPKKKGAGARVMGFFKGTTAGAIETKLKTDNIAAVAGSSKAKDHLGILPKRGSKKAIEGPIEFKGRYRGRKGAVYIDSSISPASKSTGDVARPCVYFTTSLSKDQDESIEETVQNKKMANPSWAISVSDITEIKKIGGLGWKAKIVVGWATEKEVKEGIEITSKDGNKYKVTALRERDELFNRLCSMGAQVWESY